MPSVLYAKPLRTTYNMAFHGLTHTTTWMQKQMYHGRWQK